MGGGDFTIIGKWCYGQGFMDLIHAFDKYDKNDLYIQCNQIFNAVQRTIDKNDMADFMLIVLQKQ